ncbi:hypothetical protein [Undibacterium terreum]|uniref:Uncharacterized protein n=1 Tax=Undibacterium terreum TaxID=1224302 RepID=A0A916U778_9BURK|nr:hypothetical protein [Undibacterium terreum]GGC62942.1 hypothetical protein GCM10011396_07400 [Undibacterium terreum]
MKNLLNLGLAGDDDDTSLKLEEQFRQQRKIHLRSESDDQGDKPSRRPARLFKPVEESKTGRRTMYAS